MTRFHPPPPLCEHPELKTNTELTREIHKLTTELHRRVVGRG